MMIDGGDLWLLDEYLINITKCYINYALSSINAYKDLITIYDEI